MQIVLQTLFLDFLKVPQQVLIDTQNKMKNEATIADKPKKLKSFKAMTREETLTAFAA